MSDKVRWLEFPRFGDIDKGYLSFAEYDPKKEDPLIPFEIKRVFWIYDNPGAPRGGHAHREVAQVFVCLSGSVCLSIMDGVYGRPERLWLRAPSKGIYVAPLCWVEMSEFTSSTVLMVLASGLYDEAEYIRDYEEWKRLAAEKGML